MAGDVRDRAGRLGWPFVPATVDLLRRKAESKDGLERGLDAQAYNNIFGEVEYDTLFVSSGGNTGTGAKE